MLYYRIYKRMRQRLGEKATVFITLDYGLFAIIIPMVAGSIFGVVLERFGIVSEENAFFIMIFFVAFAIIYIEICERYDKGS